MAVPSGEYISRRFHIPGRQQLGLKANLKGFLHEHGIVPMIITLLKASAVHAMLCVPKGFGEEYVKKFIEPENIASLVAAEPILRLSESST